MICFTKFTISLKIFIIQRIWRCHVIQNCKPYTHNTLNIQLTLKVFSKRGNKEKKFKPCWVGRVPYRSRGRLCSQASFDPEWPGLFGLSPLLGAGHINSRYAPFLSLFYSIWFYTATVDPEIDSSNGAKLADCAGKYQFFIFKLQI